MNFLNLRPTGFYSVLTAAFFLCTAMVVTGQNLQQAINQSSLIVEAEVVSSEAFWNDARTRIYTSHLVEIKTDFTGVAPGHPIEVITIGGSVDGIVLTTNHSPRLSKGWKGLLFLKSTSVKGTRAASFTASRSASFRIADQAPYHYGRDIHASFQSSAISDIESELLEPIERATGFDRHIIDADFERPMVMADIARDLVDNLDFFPDGPQAASSGITIEYLIENPEVTGTFPMYFEFDLSAKASIPGTDFAKGEIWVNYNIDAFGPNIVGNGYLTWTEETFVATGDYTVFAEDLAVDKVKLRMEHTGQLSVADLNELPIVEEAMIHLKLQINDFTELADIFLDEVGMQDNSEYRGDGLHPYDVVIAVDEQIPLAYAANPAGLDFAFANENVIDIGGDSWFETEILAKTDSDSVLVGRLFPVVEFDPAVFPNMQNLANWEIVPAGMSLNPSVQVDNSTPPTSGNLLPLRYVDTLVTGGTLTALPATGSYLRDNWQVIFKMRARIDNCDLPANTYFNEASTSGGISSYWVPPGTPPYLFGFAPVSAIDTFNAIVCPDSLPVIYSISPKNVTAGTFDTLTLNGVNLGSQGSHSALRFVDVDDPNGECVTDAADLISWDSTEAKFYVPSAGTFTGGGGASTASTGPIRLQLADSTHVNGPEDVIVDYALLNIRDVSDLDYSLELKDYNGLGAMEFYVQDSLASIPGAMECIEAALLQWRCATGSNIEIVGTTSISSGMYDSTNVIYGASPTELAPGTLAENFNYSTTGLTAGFCMDTVNAINNFIYHILETDIAVNPIHIFKYDTAQTSAGQPSATEYDFYSVILHELGHTHLCGHVESSLKIMKTSIGLGDTARTLNYYDQLAGVHSMQLSSDTNQSAVCPAPMVLSYPTNCVTTGPQDISEFKVESGHMLLYPNPTLGELSVTRLTPGSHNFRVVDMYGRILETRVVQVTSESEILRFDLGEMPNAMYTVVHEVDGLIESKQIILMK